MSQHPKDGRNHLSRREFLIRAGMTGVALPSLGAILAACAKKATPGGGGSVSPGGLKLASPDNPVTLPVTSDNPPIADGLQHEGGPLKIFGYNDYIYKKVLNQFKDTFGVGVQYTVFDTPDEMVSKMKTNGSDFDLIVTVTLENIGKLGFGKLIQPLNQSYLPNVGPGILSGLPDFYDVGRVYAAPYVIYTTGIAWRNDMVSDDIAAMDNPYDIYWDTRFAGKTHLLNGSRDLLAAALLRRGYSPNETDPTKLDQVKQDLLDGANTMGWKYDHVDYTELSTNSWEIHNTWSGQMAYYQYYLPKGVDITALSYLWPPQGAGKKPGLISHDLFAIPKGAANPVLAHQMINFLYDTKTSLLNYSYEGYQPAINAFTPDIAVSGGYLPESLAYTIITPDMVPLGVSELELAPAATQLYQQIYTEVTGGA